MTIKNELRFAISDNNLFSLILVIFETNNSYIKTSEKERLQSKYQWINRNYSPPTSDSTCFDDPI